MTGVGVSCGCGRQMSVDALRGKNAFRCGCGGRVRVEVRVEPSCGAVAADGDRCPVVSVRESADCGIFLCKDHFAAHEERLEEIRQNATDERAHRAYWEYEEESCRTHNRAQYDRRQDVIARARAAGRVVVYYVRIGDWIKIGTTTNFEHRMSVLQPDEILATEPGYLELEKVRHQQFKHLRIRPKSERHRTEPDLLAHIEMIRSHYGEPKGQFDASGVSDVA